VAERGQFHLFLYSPPHNIQFFRGWGFYPLVEVPQLVVLMELFREYIAPALGITDRYVGAEPFDPVTNQYNRDMKTWLEQATSGAPPVTVVEVPRAAIRGTPISAAEVRRLLAKRDFSRIKELVPATTLQFLETKFAPSMSATHQE